MEFVPNMQDRSYYALAIMTSFIVLNAQPLEHSI
jgi:hypothetical protein